MYRSSLIASLPLTLVALTSLAVMVAIAVKRSHAAVAAVSLCGLIFAFLSLWPASALTPAALGNLLLIDQHALVYMGLIIAASAALILLSFPYLAGRSEHKEEFYLLLLLATVGSAVLPAATHMASLFLGLELLSVSLYALISYPRIESLPLEAGLKYLVLAASSSAFLLFGLALIYIATGTVEFSRLAAGLTGVGTPAYLAGTVLVLTGLGFKLAIVPFHLWTPDVYQGAPLPATAFIATVSKGGVFGFLLRWLQTGTAASRPLLAAFAITAVASMLIGNLLALRQNNVKRLLAYSSIAHMGYFLVAVVAAGTLGRAAATYYFAAYLVTILGAFGSMLALSTGSQEAENVDHLQGVFWRRPLLGSVFTAMILSLAGIPLTAGFLGKFYVFAAGASVSAWSLLLVLVVSSTIGLAYYLRLIVAMFSDAELPVDPQRRERIAVGPALVLTALTLSLFALGVYPAPLWNAITTAVAGVGAAMTRQP